jgi:hypothetical protein
MESWIYREPSPSRLFGREMGIEPPLGQVVWVQGRAGRVRNGIAAGTQAVVNGGGRRIERRIDDADAFILGQESLLVSDSRLQVVNTFHVGHIGPKSCVG